MVDRATPSDESPSGNNEGGRATGPNRPEDQSAGFVVRPEFQRFRQRNDIFNRSHWDPAVRSEKSERFFATYRQPLAHWRRAAGFTQKDYALRNAAWHVTDIFAELKETEDRREGYLDEFTVQRPSATTRIPPVTPEAMSKELKRVAKLFGADLVGMTHFDPRWVYTHKYSRQTQDDKPNELPDDLSHVIVIVQSMDRALLGTVPSALSGAATGLGYSKDTLVLLSLAQYIRNLGYRAVASLNDTALSIPLAIQAGLGEYGRHGLLITKEFGPRVRLGKIFTDLPLAHDRPVQFGVRAFCEVCRRCSDACPPQAIPAGEPSDQVYNRSNIIGVCKWTVDAERCFGFWANQNSECSICIRVCPYNKDFSKWYFRLGRWLAGTRLRRLMLRLDIGLGFGRRQEPRRWWQQSA